MYELNQRIRFSETDQTGRLTTVGLVNAFQDCNTFQAEDLGYTNDYYRSINRGWILSAWQIVIHRKPVLGENVKVCTWPYGFKGFLGYRNYTMDTMEGERLAQANAIWTLIDLENKTPVKATEREIQAYTMSDKLNMEYAPRKIKITDKGIRKEAMIIGRERLDSNGHMNNAQYIGLAEEFVSENMQVSQIRVEYKKEVRYGMKIIPIIYIEETRICVVFEGEEGQCHAVVEFQR